jgi:hypothetical protein
MRHEHPQHLPGKYRTGKIKKVLKGSHITSRFCQKEVEKTGSLSIEQ